MPEPTICQPCANTHEADDHEDCLNPSDANGGECCCMALYPGEPGIVAGWDVDDIENWDDVFDPETDLSGFGPGCFSNLRRDDR